MLTAQQINDIAHGIDEHLRKLESMTGILREVKASIDELRHSQERTYMFEMHKLQQTVADLTDQLRRQGISQSTDYEKELKDVRSLLEEDRWPNAVDPECIVTTDNQKRERATGILQMLVAERLSGKRVLDFGCGDGEVVEAAKSEGSYALGYDVDLSKCNYPQSCTDNFDVVRKQGPWDIIILHDVLDHAVIVDPIEILRQAKSVLAPKGKMYVLCHPWSSRHGGHVYTQKNKAFLHLVMDEIELTRVGPYQCEPNVKITTPLETYRYWFDQARLEIISEIPIRTKVEDFFLHPSSVNERLKKLWPDPSVMANFMEISFVEYTLQPMESHEQIF